MGRILETGINTKMQIRLDPYYGNAITDLRRSTSAFRTAKRILAEVPVSRPRRSYRIYKWETSVPTSMLQALAESGITVREGSQEDLTRMEQIETWRDIDEYRGWLSRGRRLLLAEDQGEIVSYVWLDFGRKFVVEQVPELRYRLSDDACYSDEAYTPRAHRGRGLRRLLFAAELQLARTNGKRFLIGYFLFDRAAEEGLRNFERVGIPRGLPLHDAILWNFAGVRITMSRPLALDGTVSCLD